MTRPSNGVEVWGHVHIDRDDASAKAAWIDGRIDEWLERRGIDPDPPRPGAGQAELPITGARHG